MNDYEMKINVRKTNIIEVHKNEAGTIRTQEGRIDNGKQYRYLATWLTEDWKSSS